MKEDFVKGTWILQLEDERGNYNNVLICNTLYAQDAPYYFYHLSIGVKLAQTEIEHITSSNVTKWYWNGMHGYKIGQKQQFWFH